jgi:hypothetical protein
VTSLSPEEAARRQAQHQVDMDTYRDHHPEPAAASVEAVLDQQARSRSHVDPAFAAGFGLLNAGFRAVACNASGTPFADAEPIGTIGRLRETWDKHPSAVAGAACGKEHNLLGLALTEDGMEWLAATAVDPGTRKRPPAEPPAGASVEPYREPGDPRPGPQAREVFAVRVTLVEVTQQRPGLASATTAPGERGRSWGEDLAAKLARPKPMFSSILCWSWPAPVGSKEWDIPVPRRVRAGVELVACVPGDGSILTVDDRHWRVSWGAGLARRMALPSWLAEALGGRLVRP